MWLWDGKHPVAGTSPVVGLLFLRLLSLLLRCLLMSSRLRISLHSSSPHCFLFQTFLL